MRVAPRIGTGIALAALLCARLAVAEPAGPPGTGPGAVVEPSLFRRTWYYQHIVADPTDRSLDTVLARLRAALDEDLRAFNAAAQAAGATPVIAPKIP